MTSATARRITVGNRNDNPAEWTDFAWDDPRHGAQTKGEVAVIRPEGTSGSLMAGLWRTGYEIAGCEKDGSCWVKYSAPLGDETMVLLEGTVRITETATGKQHHVGAGTILSHPKGVDLLWEIDRPFLKKFWVMWDSPEPATKSTHLFVANINDNPAKWTPFTWEEPGRGMQTCGELNMIRDHGSTGTYLCCLWRTGVGMPGCAPDGSATTHYTAPLGDETILLLEGEVDVVNEETGEAYHLRAGDVIGLPSGVPVRWTSRAPFVKKFSVITKASLPGK